VHSTVVAAGCKHDLHYYNQTSLSKKASDAIEEKRNANSKLLRVVEKGSRLEIIIRVRLTSTPDLPSYCKIEFSLVFKASYWSSATNPPPL